MPFQFKSEEVHCIMKACENHTFSGPKPACLANLTQRLTLSAKEFRDLVRYLKRQRHASVGYLQYGQNGKPS